MGEVLLGVGRYVEILLPLKLNHIANGVRLGGGEFLIGGQKLGRVRPGNTSSYNGRLLPISPFYAAPFGPASVRIPTTVGDSLIHRPEE